MTQTLRAQPVTLAATFPSAPGAVAVDVARLDGTLIRTAAPATVVGDVASIALTATETATLDTLTAAFTSATLGTLTTTVEVVGAVLFTVAEARAFDKAQLADPDKYQDAAILAARDRITARFERVCKVSFIPRYRLRTIAGEDWYTLTLPDQPIIAVRAVATRVPGSPTFVDFTSDQLAALDSDLATGVLSRGGYYGNSGLYTETRLPSLTVRAGYEYGYATPPEPIRRAALTVCVNELVPTNIGERTMSFSDQNGETFRYATPGVGRFSPYGLPTVDAVLADYRESMTGIA